MRSLRTLVVSVAVLVGLLAACGDDDDGGGASVPTGGEADADLVIVSKSLQFDPREATVPAGEITILHDNQDVGIQHNIHFKDAPGNPKTELESGKVQQRLTVEFEAGEYEFVCDLHPNMTGTLTVE